MIEKIKHIIKIYYIINCTLIKIINNFDFLNKTSGQNYVKKSNINYLDTEKSLSDPIGWSASSWTLLGSWLGS
jgi:hypothetical protein